MAPSVPPWIRYWEARAPHGSANTQCISKVWKQRQETLHRFIVIEEEKSQSVVKLLLNSITPCNKI